jgi:NAD(P)-dependent dehydrogenase (short-subunit alcohol dehydrogenase family)
MKNTALVTGANTGIGFEACHQLAQWGYTVFLSSSDSTKGQQAAASLADVGLDVCSVDSGLQRSD